MKRLSLLFSFLLIVFIYYEATHRKILILWIGDSLVDGFHLDRSQALPTQAHELLGPDYALIANTGASGWSLKLLYEHRDEKIGRYLSPLNKLRYARIYVPVEEGINNLGAGDVSLKEYEKYWTKLCAYIVERSGIPIVIIDTPCGEASAYTGYYAKNHGGTQSTEQLDSLRRAFIAWQVTNWKPALHAAGLLNLARTPGMSSLQNTADFAFFQSDRVHSTAKDYQVEAQFCAPQLRQIAHL